MYSNLSCRICYLDFTPNSHNFFSRKCRGVTATYKIKGIDNKIFWVNRVLYLNLKLLFSKLFRTVESMKVLWYLSSQKKRSQLNRSNLIEQKHIHL